MTATRRDAQRSKVYRWERLAIDKWPVGVTQPPALTLAECQALVNRIWRNHSPRFPEGRVWAGKIMYNAPKVRHSRGTWAWGGLNWIKLPPWARDPRVVCHEVGHALVYGDRHGPTYVRVYIELLARYCGADRTELAASAKEAGVKVAPWATTKRALRLRGLGG